MLIRADVETEKIGGKLMPERLKSILSSYLADGIILIFIGIATLIWPDTMLRALCIAIGIVLVILGLVKVISYFAGRKEGVVGIGGAAAALGVIQIIAGIALIAAADFFVALFFIITGILLIYGAVMMFIRAYRLRSSRGPIFTLVILFGILDLLLGITILINPVIFAEVITQLEGISLIVGGVGMIVTVWDVKRMARPR